MKLIPWTARQHSGSNGLRNGLVAKAKLRRPAPKAPSRPDASTMRKLALLAALAVVALTFAKRLAEIRRLPRAESI